MALEGESVKELAIDVAEEENGDNLDRPKSEIKYIVLLAFGWCFGISASFAQIGTGTYVATMMVGPQYGTLPLGLIMIASGISAAFIPMLSQKLGTKIVFLIGASMGVIGGTISFVSIYAFSLWGLNGKASFGLFILGAIPQGFTFACTNNFRMVATEFSTKDFAPKAVSLVLVGGILAGPLGPLLVTWSKHALPVDYAGAYAQVMVLYALLFAVVSLIDFSKAKISKVDKNKEASTSRIDTPDENAEEVRSLWTVVSQRKVISVILLQAFSYSSMAALMSSTPLAMEEAGFSFNDSNLVIMTHLLGMYVPSLFTGKLTELVGSYNLSLIGFLLLEVGSLIFFAGETYAIYMAGLFIVGVGWNFSFIPSSATFTGFYTPEEKGSVLGFSEFVVIGSLALITSTSGAILAAIGWINMVVLFACITGIAIIINAVEIYFVYAK